MRERDYLVALVVEKKSCAGARSARFEIVGKICFLV